MNLNLGRKYVNYGSLVEAGTFQTIGYLPINGNELPKVRKLLIFSCSIKIWQLEDYEVVELNFTLIRTNQLTAGF